MSLGSLANFRQPRVGRMIKRIRCLILPGLPHPVPVHVRPTQLWRIRLPGLRKGHRGHDGGDDGVTYLRDNGVPTSEREGNFSRGKL